MGGERGLGQLLGDRLAQLRAERGLSQQEIAKHVRQVGLPWSKATVNAFESGRRQAVALEELILLSSAFKVEPGEWFVGTGWVDLSPQDRAALGVIRAMLAGSPLDSLVRISERLWDLPQFRNAPGALGAQFERLNSKIRAAQLYLGPDVSTETAIRAVAAAAGEMEVRAAYKYQVEPIQVALEAFKNWGRGLTQERDRRFSEFARQVSFRFLLASRGRISRALLREMGPVLRTRRVRPHFGGLLIET